MKINMAEIILSSPEMPEIMLAADGSRSHNKMKNLDFENSGHTGFQKELTEQQLAQLSSVKDKENVSNKTTTVSQQSTDEQYPSAKAVFNAIKTDEAWEHIAAGKITENVMEIMPALGDKYKKLYVYFIIPSMKSGSTQTVNKARLIAYVQNEKETTANTVVHMPDGNIMNDVGNTWSAVYKFEMMGNCCVTNLWWTTTNWNFNSGYAIGFDSTNLNNTIMPRAIIKQEYISKLKISMISSDKSRYFPEGTTFELWGVKA